MRYPLTCMAVNILTCTSSEARSIEMSGLTASSVLQLPVLTHDKSSSRDGHGAGCTLVPSTWSGEPGLLIQGQLA